MVADVYFLTTRTCAVKLANTKGPWSLEHVGRWHRAVTRITREDAHAPAEGQPKLWIRLWKADQDRQEAVQPRARGEEEEGEQERVGEFARRRRRWEEIEERESHGSGPAQEREGEGRRTGE